MIKSYVSNPVKIAEDIKDLVLSGDVNPILIKVIYDAFSDAMKDAQVKDAILSEADLHGKEFEISGFKFMKMSRTTYDFKHDSVWQELESLKKSRESLMKQAMENEIADSTTGEIIPPAVKKSSEFLKRVK